MIWFVIGIMVYLLIAVATSKYLRGSGDSEFQGSSNLDYTFCGFVGLFWFLYLPLYIMGRLAAWRTK